MTEEITVSVDSDFLQFREAILGIKPEDPPLVKQFDTQQERDDCISYINDGFKRKGVGSKRWICQLNGIKKEYSPLKKQATPESKEGDVSKPSRNRTSKLIPKERHCAGTMTLSSDPSSCSVVITGHTCEKRFNKVPSVVTKLIDQLLMAQFKAGMAPDIARGVIKNQLEKSPLGKLIPTNFFLTKHINNRSLKQYKLFVKEQQEQ